MLIGSWLILFSSNGLKTQIHDWLVNELLLEGFNQGDVKNIRKTLELEVNRIVTLVNEGRFKDANYSETIDLGQFIKTKSSVELNQNVLTNISKGSTVVHCCLGISEVVMFLLVN